MNIKQLKIFFFTLIFVWTLILATMLTLELRHIEQTTEALMKKEAIANYNKDQAIRNWVASHGGVYVPIDSVTPASKYLSHIEKRDVITNFGDTLTLMNPAYMIRQLNEFYVKDYGIVGHLTSLKLIRPENKPDKWERTALEQFENGITRVSEYNTINSEEFYRLIKPMKINSNCLKCHSHQGYEIGDIRGGIAVSVPTKKYSKLAYSNKRQAVVSHSLLWIIITIVLSYLYLKFKNILKAKQIIKKQVEIQHKKIQQKNKELEILNSSLESKVKERTQELTTKQDELIVKNKSALMINEELKASVKQLKTTEQELQLFRLMIESSGDPTFMINDDENCRMIYVNEAARKHFDAPLEEIYTWRLPDWDFHSTYENLAAHVEKMKKLKNLNIETIHIVKGGRQVPVEISLNFIEYRGHTCHFGYFKDISIRNKAKEALEKSEASLKESNATKDKFFSIIAHDLKSPFNALMGFSDILLRKHKEYDHQKREKIIRMINKSSKSAYSLLENLLTWSRSQSGKINYSPEKLELKIVLFETMFGLQAQANNKEVEIINNIYENETIFADKNMITTVLRNLISNAIKFTNKKGTVTISAKKQTDNNFIEISISDTGIGIPKERIGDLFRIDKNKSTQGTENETGTGLGLILCKEFAEKHAGKIWVESEEEKGSSFIFTIPC